MQKLSLIFAVSYTTASLHRTSSADLKGVLGSPIWKSATNIQQIRESMSFSPMLELSLVVNNQSLTIY